MWIQRPIKLEARSRGFHVITRQIEKALPELGNVEAGVLHIFIQHTSAALTINENADPTVRLDFESVFNRLIPEGQKYYRHNDEGPDDLPAHIKSSLVGSGLTIPVSNGNLNLGTWQGIYLCEFRNHAGGRDLILTLNGTSSL